MHIPRSAGGFHAIWYTLKKARASGGILNMYSALRAKNACKTCALGMGGQLGGMVNERGHFPEFCKKSVQAISADMQPAIPAHLIEAADFGYLDGLSSRQLEAMGRVVMPLVAEAGSDRYRATTWEKALSRISAKLTATAPDDTFFYASGRSSNEAGFLLQLFARLYGTNHINNCSFYCHQASGVGLTEILGGSTGTVPLGDLDHTDLLILIGANPASNHPRFMRTLMELKRRGGKVIVINPVRETGLVNFSVPSDPRSLLFGTTIADVYVQPHIGGDIALLLAVARRVLDHGGEARAWLESHTTNWPALEAHLRTLDVDALAAQAGVTRAEIDTITALYLRSTATVFAWAMGITHHLHGVDNVRAIADLALLRGMCARPGAGLLPLRGHSNIQGLGTVGVTPKLKQELLARVEARLGTRLPTGAGLDTMQAMERAAAGQVRAAWCLGGNLFGANPDATFAKQSLSAIDQVVYLTTTLNTGHIHGRGRETWILPVLPRDEEPQPTTQESMFSYVRLSDGGRARHSHLENGPRSETQVIAGIAQHVLGTRALDWSALENHGEIRRLIADTVPGLEPLATIEQTKTEFHIAGRALGAAGSDQQHIFHTPDGRAHLAVVQVPRVDVLGAQEVRLMTARSEGQFNTVVYEDHDRYRGTERRDVILLHVDDLARLGLRHDQRVTVRSSAGAMPGIRVRTGAIRAGNALMYYPEANVLVPRAVDPESGTPAFKNVLVTIMAAE